MTRVLVVDDQDDIRLLETALLKKRGFEVEEAVDGESALFAVRSRPPPDVVLLDVRMPPPDGLVVLDIIRAESIPVRVVIISAHADSAMKQDAVRRGADAFVVKPFTAMELYDVIDRVLVGTDE